MCSRHVQCWKFPLLDYVHNILNHNSQPRAAGSTVNLEATYPSQSTKHITRYVTLRNELTFSLYN